MYGAWITQNSWITIPNNWMITPDKWGNNYRYQFGTGDFTVAAMVQPTQAGGIFRCGDITTGAFVLRVDPETKRIVFEIFQYTYTCSATTVDPVTLFDGVCHYVAGVRQNGNLAIFVDGIQIPCSIEANSQAPISVNPNDPIFVGMTIAPKSQGDFTGLIMNVGIWQQALTSADLKLAMFNRPTSADANLVGHWTLDQNLLDSSPSHNTAYFDGAGTVISWKACHHCLWAVGDHHYVFCQMSSDGQADDPLPCIQTVTVEQGTSAIYCSIVDTGEQGHFPQGAQVTLTDPAGKVYNQDTNTDSLFVKTVGNSLWLMCMTNPPAGTWKIMVTTAHNVPFLLQFQSVPASDPVNTSVNTLKPLFGSSSMAASTVRSMGVLSTVKDIAIAGVVGLALGVTGMVTVPAAVVAAIVTFGILSFVKVQSALQTIGPTMAQTSRQIGGMLGYTKATKAILIIDPNSPQDPATQMTYSRRLEALYPYIDASPYVEQQVWLFERDVVRSEVHSELIDPQFGYVTASGHGRPFYLMGWSATDTLPEILTKGNYDPAEARGKIFHFFSCHTGYTEANNLGLGADLVAHGAKAFFGYKDAYTILIAFQKEFCDCDIAIDKALIEGKTAEEAHNAAIAVYNDKISYLRGEGKTVQAATLENNRNLLVSPVTDARFGDKLAKIE